MRDKEFNLLDEKEWTGTFFPPNHQDQSFAGSLKFSPVRGLSLEYARPLNLQGNEEKISHLHGNTSKGIPLTLVGEFKNSSGFKMMNGLSYETHKNYPFEYALFGYHFDPEEKFDTFYFEITDLESFLTPSHLKGRIPHSKKEIIKSTFQEGEISIVHTSEFQFLGEDLRSHIYSDKDAPLNELQLAYEKILRERKDFLPYLKKNLSHSIRLKPSKKITIREALKLKDKTTDLFSILYFNPCKIINFIAIARTEENSPREMFVIPNENSEHSTIEICRREKAYENIPINFEKLNLEKLISKWMSSTSTPKALPSSLQHETKIVPIHQIHGEIVLYATQLEWISISEGRTKSKEKFQYSIDKYASSEVKNKISRYLSCPTSKIGEKISDLRNDIAHIGRPQKIINKMSTRDVYMVARAIKAIVATHTLQSFSVTKEATTHYQNNIWI